MSAGVFNPCADSYRHASLPTLCRRQEQLKRNAYDSERVRQVERASFDPLVFTTSGSASPAATVVLAEARDLSYSTVMGWLRCRLSFCLLQCAVICVFAFLSIPTHHSPTQCRQSTKPCLLCSKYTFSPAELSSERGEKEVLADSTQLGGGAAAINAVARELLRSACLPGERENGARRYIQHDRSCTPSVDASLC